MALGNALSDPFNMLEYADFAYQTGLVDVHGKNSMRLFELLAKEYYPSIESKIVSMNIENLLIFTLSFLTFGFLPIKCAVLGHNALCIHSKQQLQQRVQYFAAGRIRFGIISKLY